MTSGWKEKSITRKEDKMVNNYLYIENGQFSYQDGVFSGIATLTKERVSTFCLEQAEETRHSDLGNYDGLSKKQREELAKRWEAAKDLPDGKYEYYFNLEDKGKIFKLSVAELAKRLGIKYELKLK